MADLPTFCDGCRSRRPRIIRNGRALCDRCLDDASLGTGHIWTESKCPAYRSGDPVHCTCYPGGSILSDVRRLLPEMRVWAEDCQWIEDADDIADMTDHQIIIGIRQHYSGGIAQFVADVS